MSKQIKNQELKSNELIMDEWEQLECKETIKVKSYKNKNNYNCKVPIQEHHIDQGEIEDEKLHEWLVQDDFVKPYYDVDKGFETKEEMETQFKIILKNWIDRLTQTFNCEEKDLGISTCNRKKTKVAKKHQKKKKENGDIDEGKYYFVSIHIIVNTHYIKQGNLEQFNIQNGFDKIAGYDKSVYSNGQNFRMIYQSKPEKDSKCFTPYNNTEDEDCGKHFIQFDCCPHSFNNEDMTMQIPCLINDSPPVSPPAKPKKNKKNKKAIKTNEDIDEVFVAGLNQNNINELKKLLDGIKNRYEYDSWWKIGSAIFTETQGSQEGKQLWIDWSSSDDNEGWNELEHMTRLNNHWFQFNKNSHKQDFTIGTLRKWFNEECDNEDIDTDNIYKYIFFNHPEEPLLYLEIDGKYKWQGKPNKDGLVKYINKELIFIRETGETIIIDKNNWYLKRKQQLLELFAPKTFTDPISEKPLNPATLWFNHKDRRSVLKIGFDPKENPNNDIFNIWTGMRIKKDVAETFDENDCQLILDHIKNRWCAGNDEEYEYVLNWFAHLIQKPWVKMGVVLCLRSKQGAGKGIILNILRQIIGDNHYFQCNNLDQLTGNFNGIGEGKILTNLDEAFWGKDKKKEGMLKNLITEETKLVNKKNKENYIVEDFCNYLVSTNNDCFIPASENERRFYALEVSDELAGIQTVEKKKLIDELLNCPAEAFAKVLYNRDISSFNPRIFNKTRLLQEQIEHSWCSVRKWWFQVLNDNGFNSKILENGFCEFGDEPLSAKLIDMETGQHESVWGVKKIKYKRDKNKRIMKGEDGYAIIEKKIYLLEKDFVYKNYEENCCGYKLDNRHFWESFKKYCLGDLMEEKRYSCGGIQKRCLDTKDIEIYQKRFNELQLYEYEYGCESIDDEDWD